jgi:SAM-dependent methyltransferase
MELAYATKNASLGEDSGLMIVGLINKHLLTAVRTLPMNYDAIESTVIRTISPADKMYVKGNEKSYFPVARSGLECIDVALRAARMDTSDVKQILDLPCGHGRVLRYLRAAFPGAQISACDIIRDGVDFCASEFGALPIYSEDDPRKIPIKKNSYDLIWVGSLFRSP